MSVCIFYCKDESLGQGSFTRNFKGYKIEIHDGKKHVTEVFLKELDVAHKNCWEVGVFRLNYCCVLCFTFCHPTHVVFLSLPSS